MVENRVKGSFGILDLCPEDNISPHFQIINNVSKINHENIVGCKYFDLQLQKAAPAAHRVGHWPTGHNY